MRLIFPVNVRTLLMFVAWLSLAACGGADPSAAPGAAPSATPSETPSAAPSATPNETPSAAPSATQRPAMELLETKIGATQDAINITGQVKNISGREVSGVTVMYHFQDASGKSLRTEQGFLETDPLAADKTSGFKISTKYDPNIKRFNVTFSSMFGGNLLTKDSREK